MKDLQIILNGKPNIDTLSKTESTVFYASLLDNILQSTCIKPSTRANDKLEKLCINFALLVSRQALVRVAKYI